MPFSVYLNTTALLLSGLATGIFVHVVCVARATSWRRVCVGGALI